MEPWLENVDANMKVRVMVVFTVLLLQLSAVSCRFPTKQLKLLKKVARQYLTKENSHFHYR